MYSPFHKFPAKKPATKKKEYGKSPNTRKNSAKHSSSSLPTQKRKPIQTLASVSSKSMNHGIKQPNNRRTTTVKKKNKTTSLKVYRRKRLRLLRATSVLIVAILLGLGLKWMAMTGFSQLYGSLRADVLQFTEKSHPLPYTQGAYLSLTREIELYIQKQPGTYGISGADLATGAQFGWQTHQAFSTAQTLALPVVVNLYSEIANHQISAHTIVHVQTTDKEAGTGFIGGLPSGTPLTVTQLAQAAIVNGDVVATNMLIRKLSPDEIDSFINGVGSHETLSDPYLVTSYDLTLYLSYLYTMDQAHPHALAPLMQDLALVKQPSRIAAGLTPGTKILQVTGDWPHEFHNAAIFWIANHPIALSICSSNVNETEANHVEAHIAQLVETFVTNQSK